MNILPEFIKNIFTRPLRSEAEYSTLRESFRKHYNSFRALLTANNTALELMAELEQTLQAGQPFSMAFVRGHCTALTVNVYKMIQQLQELADGRYLQLTPVFKEIAARLETTLAREPETVKGKHILSMAEIDRHAADQVGEKMANLGEVRNQVGLHVPDGFVITATATRFFIEHNKLKDEINRRLKTLDHDNLEELYTTSAAIQQLISNAPLPRELAAQISQHYRLLASRTDAPPLVSLRSSALGEDRDNISFAGQYRTQLNVSEEFIGQTYKEIVASKYKSQALIYRLQRGFRHQDVTMCVGCLTMIDGICSGVIYSRSPDNPRSSWVLISAAPGLADQVVDGTGATDFFQVERSSPNLIRKKELQTRMIENDHARNANQTTLSDEQAGELTRIAVRLEEHFGTPQDIEWSIERDGRIVILQSRPLGGTTLSALAAPTNFLADPGRSTLLTGGVTASRGVACGPVYIVKSNIDLLQFPKGAVLVVCHPLPEWATLLSRAVAVISETGQVAAHLATVARELGIPAIFAMTEATGKLVNGQSITIDATGGCVYEGRVEEILAQAAPPKNLMAGSPLHNLLAAALKIIAPLNLTNPASPYFRASSCETLHDLTRFCHEKAVTEMFSFGSRHGFSEKDGKRLVGESPFDWWVINLDDGFREGFDRREKFININDIVSTPMLAIWQGMTAVPWQGPPPVSLKGFGSILFQSTMNPNLDPAVRSTLTARNYFLVSKNFCNLSVRLGYHFSLVEAHLSDLLTENYVSFQFKGGAADENRRLQRVFLLKDILQQFDFRVEQKGDALTARIEKKTASYLMAHLTIIGYLLIHTRQIDMVMDDQEMIQHYRKKILADLNEILVR
ncbi:MAG: pyruvate, water dikinase [Proteobacteria bacterium]|nr:pyruvate, water dikinase [Pseudomonadota bacterium]MBU1714815.1 pyruvate, water dikinase [Pseudomonadota bacterium]